MIEAAPAKFHYEAFGTHLPRALPPAPSEGSWPWHFGFFRFAPKSNLVADSNGEAERRAVADQSRAMAPTLFHYRSCSSVPRVRSSAWLERTPNNATVRARSARRNRSREPIE
jgi:hypothetical protein